MFINNMRGTTTIIVVILVYWSTWWSSTRTRRGQESYVEDVQDFGELRLRDVPVVIRVDLLEQRVQAKVRDFFNSSRTFVLTRTLLVILIFLSVSRTRTDDNINRDRLTKFIRKGETSNRPARRPIKSGSSGETKSSRISSGHFNSKSECRSTARMSKLVLLISVILHHLLLEDLHLSIWISIICNFFIFK